MTIDTSDMFAIHDVFRDAFGSAEERVGSAADDPARRALIGSYYTNVLTLLQVHHEGEDELLWPKLTERRPEQAALFAEMAAQHTYVHGATSTAIAAVDAWVADPTSTTTPALIAALTDVYDKAVPHLDQEERDILPIAAEVISGPEWGELPKHGLQNFTGDKPWLILGLIRDNMTPEALAQMDASMPPPAVEFWETAGHAMYDGFISQVR